MKHPYKTALLVIGDVVVLYVSLVLTLIVRYGSLAEAPLLREHFAPFSIVFAFWVVVFFIHNLYDFTAAKNTFEFYRTVFRALFINAVVALTFFYLIPFFEIAPKRNLLIYLAIFTLLFSLWRQVANSFFKTRLHAPTLLMGQERKVAPLAMALHRNPQIGYRVIGIFTDKLPTGERPFFTYIREDLMNLEKLVNEYEIETIITEETILADHGVVQKLDKLIGTDIAIVDFENFKERLTRKVDLEKINERWFLQHAATGKNITYDTFKRLLDIVSVIVFSVPALIIGILTAALVKLQDGGPVFYKQVRTGQHGDPFTLIKFRTMVPNAEKKGPEWAKEKDPRVTKVGRFLRLTRLDEIPQFLNIIKGDISFVGPRSERPEFDSNFSYAVPFYERRYLVKPGLTGWAQINYPYVSSVEDAKERLAYDLFYLKYRSLVFDVGVILKTIDLMLRGLGR